MKKLFKQYCQASIARTNALFKNYSKWFRWFVLGAGPVLTLQLILVFLPESLPIFLLEVLGLTYFIIAFALFLVESVIHGVRYLRNN
ncbi:MULTISPECIES: hypothetical protein [Lactobacillaceae]|uniref:hypothetical protein n=1 Tax=Lactobacillaceae TaxID=33958 RepID=UPI001457842F|nr:hypothetical protein [Lactobacillus sp. HBUAS51381]NLR09955.1 hypothetical protein [Lactobacillus sp. HBUAS51381]